KRGLPDQVLVRPELIWNGAFGDSGAIRAAKPRPIGLRRKQRRSAQQQQSKTRYAHDAITPTISPPSVDTLCASTCHHRDPSGGLSCRGDSVPDSLEHLLLLFGRERRRRAECGKGVHELVTHTFGFVPETTGFGGPPAGEGGSNALSVTGFRYWIV